MPLFLQAFTLSWCRACKPSILLEGIANARCVYNVYSFMPSFSQNVYPSYHRACMKERRVESLKVVSQYIMAS